MMTAHSPRPSPLVMSLPLELTELILIFTAILGFPEAIAVVAQTCQVMRTLIYDAPDQHLWREIYLTTFDDPRVSEGSDVSDHTQYHPNPCEDSGDKKDFNWGAEFRWRVWTANYVRRATSSGRMPPSGHPSFFPGTMLQSEMAANLVALESLLSVIKTALPYPPPAQIPPPSSSSSEKPPPTRHPTYPVFPHSPASYAPTARDTPIKGNGPSVLCPNAPDLSPSYVQSLNIRWFQSVLSSGFPPLLTARFSGDQLPGGPQGFWEGQVETKMMHTFGKLLTATGFLPIPFVGVVERRDASTQTEKQCDEDLHTGEEDGASSSSTISSIGIQTAEASFGSVSHQTILENEAETTFSSLSFNPNMTAEAQRRRARRVARMRVYNMRYLARERHWGPYLYPPASASGLYARPSAGDHEDDFLEPILSIFAEHEAGHPNHDQDDETSDSDDENHPYGDNGIPTGLREPIPLGPPPSPSLLRADWSYLAAVRVVVEANLREAVGPEELMGLMWLDGLRIGSAPREMLPGGQCKEECMYSEPSKGKGKEKDIGDGWDWAGVSGVWR